MQFDFVKPEDVTEWVIWVEDAIVIREETQGPDGEDLPGDLVILGDSEQSGDKLRQILEGIGYSSQRKAAMDNAKRGFRGT